MQPISLLLTAMAIGLARPDIEFQVFQFPADQIPRIDGNAEDWSIVPDSYAIGMEQLRETVLGIGKAHDLTNLDVRVTVGWVKGLSQLYFLYEAQDNYWDFDLHAHLAKSFGVYHGDGDVHVKVRFTPTVSRYVEESHWHASQELSAQRDGSLVAAFDLDNTEEIKRWIMSFGKHALVLEPDALRDEIVAELAALMASYGKGGSEEDRFAAGSRSG